MIARRSARPAGWDTPVNPNDARVTVALAWKPVTGGWVRNLLVAAQQVIHDHDGRAGREKSKIYCEKLSQ